MGITNINHTSFTVKDLKRAISFYESLGLKVVDVSERTIEFSERVTGIQGVQLKIAYLTINQQSQSNCSMVELIQSPQNSHFLMGNKNSTHLCFDVDNFKELCNRLKAQGVNFLTEPDIIPGGPNKGKLMVYLQDLDRNKLELISKGVLER